MSGKSDLFVLPGPLGRITHTLFRLAGLLAGIIVFYFGVRYNNVILKIIGGVTAVVDAFTFSVSLAHVLGNA